MNVSETDKEIRITAELPGVDQNDVDVSLDDDVLTIRGEKKFEQKEEKENFHFVERSYSTFQRSVRLPFPVDPEQVNASFENGVLTVSLPKTAQQERSRRSRSRAPRTCGGRCIRSPGIRLRRDRFRRCRSREVARRKHLRRRIGKFAQPERPLTPPARVTSHAIGEARVEGGAERPDEGPRRFGTLIRIPSRTARRTSARRSTFSISASKQDGPRGRTSADLVEIDGKIAHEAFDHLAP